VQVEKNVVRMRRRCRLMKMENYDIIISSRGRDVGEDKEVEVVIIIIIGGNHVAGLCSALTAMRV